MNTREQLMERISSLTEEQIKFLFEITDDMLSADKSSGERHSARGILHEYANPDLREFEETAWAEAAAEEELKFLAEYGNENS